MALIKLRLAPLLTLAMMVGASPAAAIFQDNPSTVTLTDVLACLTLFQNPGVNLSAEQIAAGVSGILEQTIPANSLNPVPTPALCNFIDQGQGGVDLVDVIAVLVVFQNPGVTLTSTQLVAGINGILGTNVPAAAVLRIPGASETEITLRAAVPAQDTCSGIQISVADTTLTAGTTFTLPSSNAPGGTVTFTSLAAGLPYAGLTTFICSTILPPNAVEAFTSLPIPGVPGSACVYVHRSNQEALPSATNLSRSVACP